MGYGDRGRGGDSRNLVRQYLYKKPTDSDIEMSGTEGSSRPNSQRREQRKDKQEAEQFDRMTTVFMWLEFALHASGTVYGIFLLMDLVRYTNNSQAVYSHWAWANFGIVAGLLILTVYPAYENYVVQKGNSMREQSQWVDLPYPQVKYGILWMCLTTAAYIYYAYWRWKFLDHGHTISPNGVTNEGFDDNIMREWDAQQWVGLLIWGWTSFRYLNDVGDMLLSKAEDMWCPNCYDL